MQTCRHVQLTDSAALQEAPFGMVSVESPDWSITWLQAGLCFNLKASKIWICYIGCVKVDNVGIDSCFGSSGGGFKSVHVLFNGTEAVMELTLIVLK